MLIKNFQQEINHLYLKGLSTRQVAKQLNIGATTVQTVINNLGISRNKSTGQTTSRRFRQPNINLDAFAVLDNTSAYLLGVIYGDGNISKNGYCATISTAEQEILHITQNYIKQLTVCKKSWGWNIQINSIDIVNNLKNFGLTPNKSATIQFPQISHEYISHFMRGLCDSDGCWYIANRNINSEFSYVSKSYQFLEQFKEHIQNHCNTTITRKIRKANTAYQLSLGVKNSQNFRNFIYADSNNLRVERKYNIAYSHK